MQAVLPRRQHGRVGALGAQDGVRGARRGAAEVGGAAARQLDVGAGRGERRGGEVVPRAGAGAGDVADARQALLGDLRRARSRGGR